jgi:S-(hydroxymethyl)glutathione dehydrogenase / alcohol dehydrogenase
VYSNCHNVNPNATAVGGIYGYSHTCGGYDGGQAEYVRVPFADVGPSLIPEWMDDEDAVLLTDALATGYFGAQLGDIAEGDVVVVFGAGPVGLFAAKSAWFMGAGRVIVIDHLDYRLEKAPPQHVRQDRRGEVVPEDVENRRPAQQLGRGGARSNDGRRLEKPIEPELKRR